MNGTKRWASAHLFGCCFPVNTLSKNGFFLIPEEVGGSSKALYNNIRVESKQRYASGLSSSPGGMERLPLSFGEIIEYWLRHFHWGLYYSIAVQPASALGDGSLPFAV